MERKLADVLIQTGPFLSRTVELEQHFQQPTPGPAWLRLSPELLKECYLLEQSLTDDGPLASFCQSIIGLLQSVTTGDKEKVGVAFHRLSESMRPILTDADAQTSARGLPIRASEESCAGEMPIEMPEATPALAAVTVDAATPETSGSGDAPSPAVSTIRLELRKALRMAVPATKVFVLQARPSDPQAETVSHTSAASTQEEG